MPPSTDANTPRSGALSGAQALTGAAVIALRQPANWIQLGKFCAVGAVGYAVGLGLSLVSDLPPGPLVVCCMTALGLVVLLLTSRGRIPT